MKKKIAIIMAYLANNLGDDIFVQQLCLRYPAVDFFVATHRFKNRSFEEIPNLHYSDEMQKMDADLGAAELPESMIKFFSKFDACVVIGGSIFMQPGKNWKNQVNRFANRKKLAKKLFVLGANFGPYSDKQYYDEYCRLFHKIEDMCFRDTASIACFPDHNNIRYAPDLVFSSDYEKQPAKKQVAISLIDCSWGGRPGAQLAKLQQYRSAYESKLVEVVSAFYREGYESRLVSFCAPQKDGEAAERIMRACLENGVTNISHCEYKGDIQNVVNTLAESECIIATRFHAMILGWLFGKAVYPIIYDHKQIHVIRDLGFTNAYCKIEDIESVDAEIVVSALKNYKVFDCQEYIREAHKQFVALDSFIKGCEGNAEN